MSIPRAFYASAVQIRLRDKPRPRKTEQWQKDAWNYFHYVGEIQHAVEFRANLISKIRLYPAILPNDPRDIPVKDTDERAIASVTALRTTNGDYAPILRELSINLDVAGEAYLVGKGNTQNEPESWEIYSSNELVWTADRFLIREYPGESPREFTDDQIIVIRIFFPDPEWGALPTSPLRGILASAEEIQRIERVIRGAAKSRSAGPGLLLVPDEISFGSPDPTAENPQDPKDAFKKALLDALVTPIQDEGDASSVVPFIIGAPGEYLDKIRKVSLAIDVDAELMKLDRAITRLAQGLPLPPEVVTGKSGLSHWGSWQVAEETITSYVDPHATPMIQALTGEYHRPFLLASGMSEADTARRILWYDVTQLVTRPNRSADADFGLEHIAISDDAWRKVKGFTDEDRPDGLIAIARLMLQRGSFDPNTTIALLKAAKILPDDFIGPVDAKQVPPTTQPRSGDTPEDRSPPAMNRPRDNAPPNRSAAAVMVFPSNLRNDDEISLKLSEVDRELRLRLHTAAEASVQRALERASATLIRDLTKSRNKSRYQTILRDTPKLEAALRVGRPAVEAEGIDVANLFSGAFDSVISRFSDWTARAYTKSARILDIPIPTPTELISSAADSLSTDLLSYATDRLFDAHARSEPFGEVEDTATFPHGIIRSALYKAGGGTDLLPSNFSPPCGISTGANVLKALVDAGGGVDGWEWVYATTVRSRDFEPHAQLDGVRFSSFKDPVLRNPGTWPPVTNLYAGDHDHCFCQVRPLIRLPDVEETA